MGAPHTPSIPPSATAPLTSADLPCCCPRPQDGPTKMAEDAQALGYTFPYLYDESQEVRGRGLECLSALLLGMRMRSSHAWPAALCCMSSPTAQVPLSLPECTRAMGGQGQRLHAHASSARLLTAPLPAPPSQPPALCLSHTPARAPPPLQVAKAYTAACTPEFYAFDASHKLQYHGQYDDARPGNGKPVTGGAHCWWGTGGAHCCRSQVGHTAAQVGHTAAGHRWGTLLHRWGTLLQVTGGAHCCWGTLLQVTGGAHCCTTFTPSLPAEDTACAPH
jgi:hypothetical protein